MSGIGYMYFRIILRSGNIDIRICSARPLSSLEGCPKQSGGVWPRLQWNSYTGLQPPGIWLNVHMCIEGSWTRYYQFRWSWLSVTMWTMSGLHLVRSAVARGRGGAINSSSRHHNEAPLASQRRLPLWSSATARRVRLQVTPAADGILTSVST